MLCLSRALGESVVIYGATGAKIVTVTVVGRRSGEIVLSFEAPPEIQIVRAEINGNLLTPPGRMV